MPITFLHAPFLRPKKARRLAVCVVLLLSLALLGACGKRPSNVDPPSGISKHDFPRVYPDPSTDPKP